MGPDEIEAKKRVYDGIHKFARTRIAHGLKSKKAAPQGAGEITQAPKKLPENVDDASAQEAGAKAMQDAPGDFDRDMKAATHATVNANGALRKISRAELGDEGFEATVNSHRQAGRPVEFSTETEPSLHDKVDQGADDLVHKLSALIR